MHVSLFFLVYSSDIKNIHLILKLLLILLIFSNQTIILSANKFCLLLVLNSFSLLKIYSFFFSSADQDLHLNTGQKF